MTPETFAETAAEAFAPTARRRVIDPLRDLAVTGLSPLASLSWRLKNSKIAHVRFVYYHYVFRDQQERFAEHLRFYRDHYQVVSHSEAVARLREGRIDGRYLSISFDDGFLNNSEVAAPILERFSMPAMFYVVAELAGFGPGDDSRLAEFSRARFGHRPLRNMGPADLRRLIAGGHEIGSHTLTHARLSRVGEVEAEREISDSKTAIEAMAGAPVRHFCFPYGLASDFPPYCRKMVEDAGYESCVSAIRGPNLPGADIYWLRRDHIFAGWSIAQLKYFTRTNF